MLIRSMNKGGVCEGESRDKRRRQVIVIGGCRKLSAEVGFFFIGRFRVYASTSKPMPTLCPPALKFLPSMRAERVTLTPAQTQS